MTVLRGAVDVDGNPVELRLDAGTVTEVRRGGGRLLAAPNETVHDLAGYRLLPAPAEPHAHLDKALTSHRVRNRTPGLAGAVAAMAEVSPGFDHDDLVTRGTRAALRYLASGATALRTHADVGLHYGLRHVDALLQVREELAGRMTIQVVAMPGVSRSENEARELRRLLDVAAERGVDVVGGAPHRWADRQAGLDMSLSAAQCHGLPLDLHIDESPDPRAAGLRALAASVDRAGFAHGVSASHCAGLGIHDDATVTATAREVAAAGVAVVALPRTALYRQGRDRAVEGVGTTGAPTAVRALIDAGVTVAAGGDNLRDPFHPMGRADPTEAASLMVTATHLTPREAWHAISGAARSAMGLPPADLVPGAPAELLALRAETLDDCVAGAATARLVFHRGRLVARTVVQQDYWW